MQPEIYKKNYSLSTEKAAKEQAPPPPFQAKRIAEREE